MKSILIFLAGFFAFGQAFAIAPITGPTGVCQAGTVVVTDATPGGTWSCSAPSIASIGPATGVVTGIGVGTVILSYTVGASSVICPFSVYPRYPITGPAELCFGSAVILNNPQPGGTWGTSNPLVADITGFGGTMVDSAEVLGLSPGTDTISYTTSYGCISSLVITVSPPPTPILGPNHICVGTTAVLTDAVVGGTWSSGAPAIASIGSVSGVATGVTAGVTAITYTIGSGCAAIMPVTVTPLPGPIAGPMSLCSSDSMTLINSLAGGTWSSSNPSIATVGLVTGTVTGLSGGGVLISYSFNPACFVSYGVTVNPSPVLSSTLAPPGICSGSIMAYTPASTLPGVSFIWSRAALVGISNPAATGSGAIAETLVNSTASPIAVSYIYNLVAGGCTNTQVVTVTVNPIPALTSSLTPPALCDSAIFNYTPAGAVAGTIFGWSRAAITGILNGAATGAGNPNEQLINTGVLPIGVNYVYVLVADGCSSTQTVTVTVNPTPMLSSSLDLVAQCDTVLFEYTPASLTPGVTYTWARTAIAGIQPPTSSGTGNIIDSITNTTSGPLNVSYYIGLSVDGCTNSFVQGITVTILPCSGVAGTPELNKLSKLNIYPNPTSGEVTIAGLNAAASLEVFNLVGQKIFCKQALMGAETVDLSLQPEGMYIVVVTDAAGIQVSKINRQ